MQQPNLKEFILESFKKEYSFRVKIAADCNSEHLDIIEKCLAKYNVVSVASFKRTPIQENPMEFVRAKGVKLISEVCSTDVVLKYPVHERILEVWLAVHLGLDHDRVLCYNVKDPRKLESDNAAERTAYNKDRTVSEDDAVLAKDDSQSHYEMQNEGLDDIVYFGEEYNKKFLDTLAKIKAEKGANYFTNYPSKDEIMGDDLKPLWDVLHNRANMGSGVENKEVDVISQSSRRN
jgi:hypothetical protein